MSQEVKRRRGTAAEHATFAGAVGEITVVTDDYSLRVHDGVTLGGHPIAGGGGSSPLTTKGDVYTHDATVDARLAVGSNGQVLTADSAQATGIKWATPATVITDHGALTGLTPDDDHPQYLKTDGSRALTGDQSAGSHKVTNLAAGAAGTDAVNKTQMDAGDSSAVSTAESFATAADTALLATVVVDGDAAGGDLTGTYPNPTVAAGAITDTKVAAANKDGASGTASMRTLGTGAAQACAGNDSRLSDSRAPTGAASGDLTGTYPNPTIAALAVTDAKVAAANKDGASGTASMRTLGTGAAQACAGNDSRLSDSRAPNGSAGGDLTGTYPNPTLAVDRIPKSIVTTKGDIIVATGSATPVRKGVPANGSTIIASSGSADGWTTGDHGGLGGLTDDDHTQYTLADGTRAFTGDQSLGSHKLTNVTDPTGAQDAATKNYVDSIRTPTLPTVISVGTEFHSTGVPTATLPGTHAANDILILVLQSSNDSNVAAPAGYKQIGPENGIGAAATAGSTKLSIFWKRDGGSETAPTIPDTGDHTYGVMFAVRGCPTTVDPFHLGGQGWKFTASTTATSGTSATWVDNTLVIDIWAHASDIAVGQASSPTNANLTSITEQFDGSTTDGTGGGIVVISGTKAVAGGIGATTMTWDNSTVEVSTRIHFLPNTNANRDFAATRPAEVQVFIGSAADLDDTWQRATPAPRRVFSQLMDGGGSGSAGRNAATAAGGGGGGGGGYDEAWFDPADLGASVTVHAGKGGAATSNVDGTAANPGVLSEFDKGGQGPLTSARRVAGTAATGAATADGGNGGCGSGRGTTALAVNTTRSDLYSLPAANNLPSYGGGGGRGGSGTTAPVGGSPADWGGGGGESGADTDAGTTTANNGWSLRGGGGGAGGRSTTGVNSGPGFGGGAAAPAAAAGANGTDSTRLPYGGSGACAGDSATHAGNGGFPGGGGGGGGTSGSLQGGGAGGHGMVVVTSVF